VEPTTLVGLVLTFVGVFVGMVMKGANPAAMFTNVAAILIVCVGAVGATVIAHSKAENKSVPKGFKKAIMPGEAPDPVAAVATLTELAGTARSEGLLAIQGKVEAQEEPFLRKALQLAVDGTDAVALQETLSGEVKAMGERHKATASWFTDAGVYAPSFGIIGAVVGLIAVMSHLDDPSKLGHGIGAAFVATFWGVFLANGIFLPFSSKLKRLSAEEAHYRKLVMQGVMALVAGSSPRVVEERLNAYLPPADRKAS
jgi:chemotaxis protein MotA